ncbi:hypothetical protein ACIB24_00320 [Spongisporangium articulatum]|uniref:PknH-like extracellular domain-containing protein n=1 Tax=Spongisporangium articulatum TaxID=3362603 RepID=A0ABW8AGL8_9ACTN
MRTLALALTAVLLAGCSGGSSGAAAPTGTPSVAPSADQSSASSPTVPAPRLTAAQAERALIGADALPAGWAVSADTLDDATHDRYDPKTCAVLALGAGALPLARVGFTQSGDRSGSLVQTTYRPAGRTPAEALAAMRSAVSDCASYQVTRGDVVTKVKTSTTTFPAVGDGTYAVLLQYSGAMMAVSDLVVQVAVGPQLLRFDSISLGNSLTQADLEKAVRAAVDRVRAA